MQQLTDVRYEVQDGLAWITIDRPERLNAFTAHTVEELIDCFKLAWATPGVGVVALTGAGERSFCVGGDQQQRRSSGDYGPSRSGLFEIEELHRLIREVPKPVIAAVNGLAIGGGHVLHVICDLSVAAEHARFGQAGPRVGSFDAGFGTGYLARVVGEKRAREIWFLCRQYSAEEAERWGLVNSVVAAGELKAEVRRYADQILALSPTALRFLKQSFNADSEHLAGQASLAFSGLEQFVRSEEAQEGLSAFDEKRPPDFGGFASVGDRMYDEELANRVREQFAGEDGVTEKRMFGGLAFLLGGNMALAVSGRGGLMVRVGGNGVEEALARPHASQVEMRGRPMTGWVFVGLEGVRTRRQLQSWVARGVAVARTLPVKGSRERRSR